VVVFCLGGIYFSTQEFLVVSTHFSYSDPWSTKPTKT
jgi:hypothetical protein